MKMKHKHTGLIVAGVAAVVVVGAIIIIANKKKQQQQSTYTNPYKEPTTAKTINTNDFNTATTAKQINNTVNTASSESVFINPLSFISNFLSSI